MQIEFKLEFENQSLKIRTLFSIPSLLWQTFGSAGGESGNADGFVWDDGPVMCMLATRAGPARLVTLFAVTTDRQLVISSYPVCFHALLLTY